MQQHTDWERSVLTHLSSSSELVVHTLSKETNIPCKQKLAPQLYGIPYTFSYVWQPNRNWHQFLLWSLALISARTVSTKKSYCWKKHPINHPPALLSLSETNTPRQLCWERHEILWFNWKIQIISGHKIFLLDRNLNKTMTINLFKYIWKDVVF